MKRRNKLFSVLGVIIFLLSVLVWAPRLLGFGSYYVSSDSMEPAILKGSLAFVEKVELENITAGEDVLVFANEAHSKTFMHRAIAVNKKLQLIYTKGDNNNVNDPLPTEYSKCIGRVKFHVPFIGYAAWALDTTVGKIVVIAIYILAVAVLFESRRASKEKRGGSQ